MVIASNDKEDIWVANVYASIDDEGTIYFVSSDRTKHSKMIVENSKVAFSFSWTDPNNPKNRKGIQGQGVCNKSDDVKEVIKGLTLLSKKLPVFREFFNFDWMKANKQSGVWVIKPTYIKYGSNQNPYNASYLYQNASQDLVTS